MKILEPGLQAHGRPFLPPSCSLDRFPLLLQLLNPLIPHLALDMARHVGVLPCPLKLQGGKLGRKSGDDACHFPWSLSLHGRALCAARAGAIVLAKATGGRRSGADIVGFAVLGAQEVAAVESGNGFVDGLVHECSDRRQRHTARWVCRKLWITLRANTVEHGIA